MILIRSCDFPFELEFQYGLFVVSHDRGGVARVRFRDDRIGTLPQGMGRDGDGDCWMERHR